MPIGVSPGEIVAFEYDGTLMEVSVPEGVFEGQSFVVSFDSMTLGDDEEPPPEWSDLAAEFSPASRKSADSGRELVLALVEHSARVLSQDMAPFLEAHVHLFDQPADALSSGEGESLECYAAFQQFEKEIDFHFESFVAQRGFSSAASCFAAIDLAVVDDVAQHSREREKLEARLRKVQKQCAGEVLESEAASAASCSAASASKDDFSDFSDDGDDDDGIEAMMPLLALAGASSSSSSSSEGVAGSGAGAGSTAARGLDAQMTFFAQPVALDEMIHQALSLTDYATFAAIMRKKCAEVRQRRVWLDGVMARRETAARLRRQLDTWASDAAEGAAAAAGESRPSPCAFAWAGLGRRLLELVAPGSAARGDGADGGGGSGDGPGGGGSAVANAAAAQSPEELRLLHKFSERGALPPADACEKRELSSLLGSPLSRLAMLNPSLTPHVMAELRRLQGAIASSTRLGEQRGCAPLIADGIRAAHRLTDQAEAAMDEAMREAERKAEALVRAYAPRN